MMHRRGFIGGTLSLLAARLAAGAPQAGKVSRIGVLLTGTREQTMFLWKALDAGLGELGYVEGRNLVAVERRFAAGRPERLPQLASELARLHVDVIVAANNLTIAAVKHATSTIPIVMTLASDPVGAGFVTSLARPGSNITGLSLDPGADLYAKHLQLLKEVVPTASRVAVLEQAGAPPASRHAALDEAARTLGVTLRTVEVRSADDLERAFVTVVRERAGAVIKYAGALSGRRRQIGDLAIKNRLPTLGMQREETEAGLLMSYGASLPDLWRRAATYVDKILKGVKPADLPVEQPTTFELVINLKTAKALGLTIPPSVLVRADDVIQ